MHSVLKTGYYGAIDRVREAARAFKSRQLEQRIEVEKPMQMMKRSEFFGAIARARVAYAADPNRDVRAALNGANLPTPKTGGDNPPEGHLWMLPMGAAIVSGIGAVKEPSAFFYLEIAERAWEWYSGEWYPEAYGKYQGRMMGDRIDD